MMLTKAAPPLIRASRQGLAGNTLWLAFTAFVVAVILAIVSWPLSAELSTHNLPGTAAGKLPTSLTSRANAGFAVVAPLPVLAIGDRITRSFTLVTPADEIGERSIYVVPPLADHYVA
jgi:hypothetical protein